MGLHNAKLDCAIIGGGAAGLSAAIFIHRQYPAATIAILEKNARVGKRLLATGNGTCNISNMDARIEHYHGASPAFALSALTAFSPEDAIHFFDSIGLSCSVREDRRVYPLCLTAAAVLDCLRSEGRACGVQELCGVTATAIKPQGNEFLISTDQGQTLIARTVLVATGGAAAPALGGGTAGYSLLTALGHTRTPLFPSIVQLRTDTTFIKALKGIRVDGRIRLLLDGKCCSEESGEIMFTEYGLSGPAVMQCSRPAADWERRKHGRLTAVLDLLPTIDRRTLYEQLLRRRALAGRNREDFLTGLCQKRVGQTMMRATGLTPLTDPCATLTDAELERLAALLKGWSLTVNGTQGMGGAQVTAGGIAVDECDPKTMMSRKIPGLFLAGEVLDIDGDCGGYNLQWAWASAHAAAAGIAGYLHKDKNEKRKSSS